MSLEQIEADSSLERGHYHKFTIQDLEKLKDAEALFERGRRMRLGIGVKTNETVGWMFISEAARQGHPVALAFCSFFGKGTEKNLQRAVQILRASAERGHPTGLR